jgi:hypothetical protein
MSFRVQITSVTDKRLVANIGTIGVLENQLRQHLGDEAERIIHVMQEYPGEVHHAHYRSTGELTLKTFQATLRGHNEVRTRIGGEARIPHNEYIRTGNLGLAWGYHYINKADAIGIIITNTAHDRPGNYYAGWVNGFIPADAKGRYYQRTLFKDIGWANFSDELNRSDIKDTAQDIINDYLKDVGLM